MFRWLRRRAVHYGLKGVAIADALSGFGGEAALARRAKYSLVNGVIRIVFVSLMPAVRTKGALVRMGDFCSLCLKRF